MKILFYLNGKRYLIRPMKTSEELDILEYLYTTDSSTDEEIQCVLDDFLSNFSIDTNITFMEKLCVFLKIREASIGSDIKVKYTCKQCNKPQDSTIDIGNMVRLAKYRIPKLHGFYSVEEASHLTLNDVMTQSDIDELDWDQYEKINKNITDYIDTYTFYSDSKCQYCGSSVTISYNNLRVLLSFVSDESFSSLTKNIHTLTYFTHNNRSDVLNMTAIQRVTELNNLKVTINEMAKKKQELANNPSLQQLVGK